MLWIFYKLTGYVIFTLSIYLVNLWYATIVPSWIAEWWLLERVHYINTLFYILIFRLHGPRFICLRKINPAIIKKVLCTYVLWYLILPGQIESNIWKCHLYKFNVYSKCQKNCIKVCNKQFHKDDTNKIFIEIRCF